MSDENQGGALTTTSGNELMFGRGGSPALQIMLNKELFVRCTQVADYMSKAVGFTPGHLIGRQEACFAVVMRAITWKLDPFAVAQSTYSPAAGKVGFEGKLCQAIIENSGMVKGGVKYKELGDWGKVMGKFKMMEKKDDKGAVIKKYPVATYTEADEEGLGVIAYAQVTGESEPREFKLMLRQAHPRNSTLWATDPLTQLKYRAARGLGNLAMPGIFMGVPFDPEDAWSDNLKDVTPPKKSKLDDDGKTIDGEATTEKEETRPEAGKPVSKGRGRPAKQAEEKAATAETSSPQAEQSADKKESAGGQESDQQQEDESGADEGDANLAFGA